MHEPRNPLLTWLKNCTYLLSLASAFREEFWIKINLCNSAVPPCKVFDVH